MALRRAVGEAGGRGGLMPINARVRVGTAKVRRDERGPKRRPKRRPTRTIETGETTHDKVLIATTDRTAQAAR